MPTTNQMISRSHVRQGRATISASAEIAPSGATSQTAGVLKGRGRLGSRTRRNSTPAETITKASSVPIDTRLPASRTVSSEATNATPNAVTIEVDEREWNLAVRVVSE